MTATEKEIKKTRKTNRHQEDYSDPVCAAEQKLWDWIYALEERRREEEPRHRWKKPGSVTHPRSY